jgi:hypothetical protein
MRETPFNAGVIADIDAPGAGFLELQKLVREGY